MSEVYPAYPELVISLDRIQPETYRVELRFHDPANAAERNPVIDDAELAAAVLLPLEADPKRYGAELAKALLPPDSKTRAEFRALTALTQGRSEPLRVRLFIGAAAPELHSFRWELLADPDAGTFLFTTPRVMLSRFMASQDWRNVKLRAKANLKALVAVAAPSDVTTRLKLPAVDLIQQTSTATGSLQGIHVDTIGGDKPVTQEALINCLRESQPDILYLVCHGAYNRGAPTLVLQNEQGLSAPVSGESLANAIGDLAVQPRLVVLASCESGGANGAAGDAGSEAFHAFAPLLAKAGVGAVVAMRGKISMDTITKVMPLFFRELLTDGQVDRALAVARGAAAAANRDDFWMMALYMRLREGRIWYQPGFAGEKQGFAQLDSIGQWVRMKKCVPILGPDVFQGFVGTIADLAADLAGANCPLNIHDKFDLAKIAQYLATQNSDQYARVVIRDALEARLVASASQILGKPVVAGPSLGQELAAAVPAEDPLQIAASLDAKVFLNASGMGLLADFLRCNKKDPVEVPINWRDERRDDQKEPDPPTPTIPQPLVYNVFGSLPRDSDDEEGFNRWVLTEDDYFDYLIRTERYKLMPQVVSDALVSGSLLFLGFPLDDWKFRVLFRLILAKGGASRMIKYNHVAVQVDPSETTLADAGRAKKIMEDYFGETKINIYWGTTGDFLHDLREWLKKVPTGSAAGGPRG